MAPNPAFHGRTDVGNYGDFITEIDDLVGRLVQAIDGSDGGRDALVVFTSDNGPEIQTRDDEGAYERARRTGISAPGRCEA